MLNVVNAEMMGDGMIDLHQSVYTTARLLEHQALM